MEPINWTGCIVPISLCPQIIDTSLVSLVKILSILAIFKIPGEKQVSDLGLTIALDDINDPGNLGTIIRTCAWFNIKTLILTENSADIFNPKCLRSGMGGHFYLNNCRYLSNNEIVKFLKSNNYFVYCAASDGVPFVKDKSLEKWALILGSEAHGINKELNIGKVVSIAGNGEIESLNVSVAGGILLHALTSLKIVTN